MLNGTNWEEELFLRKKLKFINILLELERNLLGTWNGLSPAFSFRTVILVYRGKVPRKQICWIRSIFHQLQKFSGKILDFAKNPQNCCQYLILRIQGNILRKFLKKNVWWKFSTSDRICSELWQKRFAHFSKQNCGRPDDELEEKNFNFNKIVFLNVSGNLSENFSFNCQNLYWRFLATASDVLGGTVRD